MTHEMTVFLQGISSMDAYASGLFFLRFWRDGRDSLFAYFARGILSAGLVVDAPCPVRTRRGHPSIHLWPAAGRYYLNHRGVQC